MANPETTTGWSDWDASARGLECEAGVGMHIHETQWLCWDEVVALHYLLGQKIESFNSPMKPSEIAG